MSQTRIKLAPYLTGTLWRVRAEHRTFILFNSLPIAKRDVDEQDWTVIAPHTSMRAISLDNFQQVVWVILHSGLVQQEDAGCAFASVTNRIG
jgi:hypothetical protein